MGVRRAAAQGRAGWSRRRTTIEPRRIRATGEARQEQAGYYLDEQARLIGEYAEHHALMLDEGDLVSASISGSELARPRFDVLLDQAAAQPGHCRNILTAVGDRPWRMSAS